MLSVDKPSRAYAREVPNLRKPITFHLARVIVTLFVLAIVFSVASIVMSLAGCAELEPTGDTSACERALDAAGHGDDGSECATVYQCARASSTHAGPTELCIRGVDLSAAELANGPCAPSRDERFAPYTDLHIDPPCFWHCPPIVGGNAMDGTFCFGGS